MRATLVIALIWLGCGSSTPKPPPADMPLPPGRDEIDRPSETTGDGNVRILGLEPARGKAAGVEAVTIRGANFRIATNVAVKFGPTPADVLRVTDDEIVVQTPPGTGVVDVTVIFGPGSELSLPAAYTYVAP